MKLTTMRPDAMDALKATLSETYKNYYTESSNDWIAELLHEDPFEQTESSPEIVLAPLDAGIPAGELDIRNCIAVHSALRFLDETSAAEETLWAGLCNGPYYGYVRTRWEYVPSKLKGTAHECSTIESRFFLPDHRSGLFRNTLAKCWWVGHLLYDPMAPDPYHKLWTLGAPSFSTKVSDIFLNNNFSFSPTVLDGIVQACEYFNNMGAPMQASTELRVALRKLNLLGGTVLLDTLPAGEIAGTIISWVMPGRTRSHA